MRRVSQREARNSVKDFADCMRGKKFHVHTIYNGPRGFENHWEATFANYIPAMQFAEQTAEEHLEFETPFEYVAVRSED